MKNIIGQEKKHINGYSYLSLHKFPSADIKKEISDELLQKANQAQFLLGKLSGITLLLPDVDYFISSYVMKDATASAQIEGTRATEIDAFEFTADPTFSNTDADDIVHYVEALNYGLKRLKEENFPFSLRFIRELHKKLMTKARATHFSDPGNFRKTQNWIGGTRPDNASFVPPAPEEISSNLKDLEEFIHTPFVHPILDAGILHAQFETIHPFLDGNGRVGRLLIIFYLIHHKYLELPVLFLSSYFKQYQKVYYQKLSDYHNGDVAGWLEFFSEAVIETAKEAIAISGHITELQKEDLSLIAGLNKNGSETALKIIKNLYKNPVVSTTMIQEWLGYSKSGTLKVVKNLEDIGILELYKKGEGSQPSLYIHRRYFNIFVNAQYDK